MNKKRLFFSLAVLVILLSISALIYWNSGHCKISDKEAIAISESFLKQNGISKHKQIMVDHSHLGQCLTLFCPSRASIKRLTTGDDFLAPYLFINCRNGEITRYYDNETSPDSAVKVNPKEDYLEKKTKFLSEQQAKNIIELLAGNLNIPRDMEFSKIEKKENNSRISWEASWIRKNNGYRYEEDNIKLRITGNTGQLIEYAKEYWGTPCPTETKITKEQAIAIGWKRVPKVIWDSPYKKKAKKFYDVGSVELLIVQPQPYIFVPCARPLFIHNKSRLAWVIYYIFKGDDFLLRDHPVEVRIDAITGQLIGGSSVIGTER